MKGSEAGGRGAFSTGDGPGSAEAWRWPGPRRLRQPCPGLGGRAGERKVAASVGRVAANEFHLEASGGSGADADFRGNTISAANFSAFPETRPFHFSPALAAPSGVPSTRFPAAAGTRGAAFREVAPRSPKTPNPVVVDSPV